jgi:peptidoglycan/LPS O-acetylase OafA/YrhL
MRIDSRRRQTKRRLEFFSLGGVLAILWRPRVRELPWIAASATLLLLSCWDVFRGAGRVDFILMGLAAYELVIGFTEEQQETQALA